MKTYVEHLCHVYDIPVFGYKVQLLGNIRSMVNPEEFTALTEMILTQLPQDEFDDFVKMLNDPEYIKKIRNAK